MKNNILNLLSVALVFTVIACTSPSTEPISESAAGTVHSTQRSAGSEKEQDMDLLLARKWQNESGKIFIDLKIDGTFEGRFDSENLITGNWKISEDKKTLSLVESQSAEGKGGAFNAVYTILDMTHNNMKVQDQDGKQSVLMSSEE